MARGSALAFFKADWTIERNSATLDGLVITKSTFQERALAAEAPGRVEQEAFAYESPAGWTVFKDEKLGNFSLLGFFNAEGEVMQLSVSDKLTTEQYAGARSRLQAVDRQPERPSTWPPAI